MAARGGTGSAGGTGGESASERFLRKLMEDPEGVDLPNFERPPPEESQLYYDDPHDDSQDSHDDPHNSQDWSWGALRPFVAWAIHPMEAWDVEAGTENCRPLPPPQMMVVPPQPLQQLPPMILVAPQQLQMVLVPQQQQQQQQQQMYVLQPVQPAAGGGGAEQPQLFTLYRDWRRTPPTKRKFPKGAVYIPVKTSRRRTE